VFFPLFQRPHPPSSSEIPLSPFFPHPLNREEGPPKAR